MISVVMMSATLASHTVTKECATASKHLLLHSILSWQTHVSTMVWMLLYASTMPDWRTMLLYVSSRPDWRTMFSTGLLVCPFIYYQTVNRILWQLDVSKHKWSTGQGHETINFGGQEVQAHRGQEVQAQGHKSEGRFGGMAEASFSTRRDE